MKYTSGSDGKDSQRLQEDRSGNEGPTVTEKNTNEPQSSQQLELGKVSIPSSADEGLVLDSRSLSQHQKSTMPDYQDSINSQRSSGGLDSLDSLERARNSAGGHGRTQQDDKSAAFDDKTVRMIHFASNVTLL